jgi:small subunit ribosomal protein S3
LGITKKSCSRWYAKGKDYAFFLREDKYLRDYVSHFCRRCIISGIEIDRRGVRIRLRISVAQVGFFVGSDGQVLEKLSQTLEKKCWSFRSKYFQHVRFSKDSFKEFNTPKIQIFVRQVDCPEADAQCLAGFISLELEKRVPFRRVLRMTYERVKNLSQVLGVRLQISGRLNGADIARTEWVRRGRVPLHTFSIGLDYACRTASTVYGLLGIKRWIFRLLVFEYFSLF